MANEVSVVVKMQQDITTHLKSIASAAVGCSKEFEQYQRRVEDLGKRYVDFNQKSAKVSAEALKMKAAMDDAKKAFTKTRDEADLTSFEKLKAQYDDLTAASKRYSQAAKDTVKKMREENDEAQKVVEGRGKWNGGGLSPDPGKTGGIGNKLRTSGLAQQVSGAVSSAASTYTASAFSQPMATAISETVSGAISGAAAGAIAGIPGMIAGGVIGTLSGAINAGTGIYQQQDDAFKAYYKGLYDTVNATTAESLTSGKELAKSRETTRVSFTTLLGDEARADAFLGGVLNTANTTPFLYDDLVGISKTLLSFGTAAEDVIPTLTKVGDAGAALGLSTGDIGTIATYLGRMQSSGKAPLEYLNPLMERGFAVFEWLAQAKGTDQATIYEMISKGELSGQEASGVILGKFEELYGGMMAGQSKTTEGLESTLQGLKENIQSAGGNAYNETRKDAYAAGIAAYGGELGEALKISYAAGGEAQAYTENLRDQYLREALDVVMNAGRTDLYTGEDAQKLEALHKSYTNAYADYTGDGADEETRMLAGKRMDDLREEAEALATAVFESSEWSEKMLDTEGEQIEAIRNNTAGLSAATAAYEKINWFTPGMAAAGGEDKSVSTWLKENVKFIQENTLYSNAYGLSRVPFDGYPALLHQGERVLTAAESRSLDNAGRAWERAPSFAFGLSSAPSGSFPAILHQGERVVEPGRGGGNVSVTVNVTGNTVRSREDLDELAERFAAAIQEKALLFGG